jgi:hypothetical protein
MGTNKDWYARKFDFLKLKANSRALCILLVVFLPSLAYSQQENLARDLANPLSDVWSIVNQINFNKLKGGALSDPSTQFNWNFQPVMPVPFNGYYHIINRMVIPYYKTPFGDVGGDLHYIPGIGKANVDTLASVFFGEIQHASGIGDIIWASLLSPVKKEGIIWGIGATFQFPTASSARVGSGLWQAGPTAGLFYVSEKFVAGVFPQHWRSLGGEDLKNPAVNYTNLQYGVSYLPTPELTIMSSANILIDWTKDEANRWTVPFAIGASYLFHFGKLPVQIGASYQWVVKHPADIEHQESIVRLIVTPVVPSPFAKKE